METYTFNKENIKSTEGGLVYITLKLEGAKFPQSFKLRSPKTGTEIVMTYNEDDTVDYAASYEFWDGEYNAHLYDGSANGKYIRVELFTTPYSE